MVMTKIKLKPCPFCGSDRIDIVLTDKKGTWKQSWYLNNPTDGIGYILVHRGGVGTEICPLADPRKALGSGIYVSREAAAKAWNKRVGEGGEEE